MYFEVLLRDREKGKFEMFYSTQNRNLNFPAATAETFKGGDPRKMKPAPLQLRQLKAVTQDKAGESSIQIFV